MATKKKTAKGQEVYVQYSKRMCTAVCVFWMLYRIANFFVMLYSPSVAGQLAELGAGVDTVMIINIGFYTGNSATEKIALAWVKRGQIEKGQKTEDDDEEEEENG